MPAGGCGAQARGASGAGAQGPTIEEVDKIPQEWEGPGTDKTLLSLTLSFSLHNILVHSILLLLNLTLPRQYV